MALRFTQGSAYRADIAALRDLVRANGTLATRRDIPVQISNPPANYALSLVLNLAWEANGALAAPNASLYTMGFVNMHGALYLFNVAPMPWAAPGAVMLGVDGSYGQLGYNVTPLPQITSQNLRQAAINLAGFAGGVPIGAGSATATDLVRCIVALSEALRFNATEQAVAAAIDGTLASFDPTAQRPRFNGWAASGHSIGV